MKHFLLFEDYSEDKIAHIVNQLREIEKTWRYFFKFDKSLQKYDIDSTNIIQKEGLNYWLEITFFENENEESIYFYKWLININIDQMLKNNKDAEENDDEIDDVFTKLQIYDIDTSTLLKSWEKNIRLENIIKSSWLPKHIENLKSEILTTKNPAATINKINNDKKKFNDEYL
jgi:hypothetical protein